MTDTSQMPSDESKHPPKPIEPDPEKNPPKPSHPQYFHAQKGT